MRHWGILWLFGCRVMLGEAIGPAEVWWVVEGMEMPPPTTACHRCGGRKLGKAGEKAWWGSHCLSG